jgi:hypothetical protein
VLNLDEGKDPARRQELAERRARILQATRDFFAGNAGTSRNRRLASAPRPAARYDAASLAGQVGARRL